MGNIAFIILFIETCKCLSFCCRNGGLHIQNWGRSVPMVVVYLRKKQSCMHISICILYLSDDLCNLCIHYKKGETWKRTKSNLFRAPDFHFWRKKISQRTVKKDILIHICVRFIAPRRSFQGRWLRRKWSTLSYDILFKKQPQAWGHSR